MCGMLNPGSSTPEGDPATASPRRGAGEELRAGRSGGYGSLEVGAAGAGGASPHRGASEVQPAGLSGERGVLEDGAAGAGEARLRRGATDEQPAGCSGGAGPWRRSGWCRCGRGARRAARAASRRPAHGRARQQSRGRRSSSQAEQRQRAGGTHKFLHVFSAYCNGMLLSHVAGPLRPRTRLQKASCLRRLFKRWRMWSLTNNLWGRPAWTSTPGEVGGSGR